MIIELTHGIINRIMAPDHSLPQSISTLVANGLGLAVELHKAHFLPGLGHNRPC